MFLIILADIYLFLAVEKPPFSSSFVKVSSSMSSVEGDMSILDVFDDTSADIMKKLEKNIL